MIPAYLILGHLASFPSLSLNLWDLGLIKDQAQKKQSSGSTNSNIITGFFTIFLFT